MTNVSRNTLGKDLLMYNERTSNTKEIEATGVLSLT